MKTKAFVSINPANGKVLKTYKTISRKALKQHIQNAHSAFENWKDEGLDSRAELMKQVAATLLLKKEEYAKLITLEMGKPIAESRAEIEKCATCCNYFSAYAKDYLQDEIIATTAAKSYVTYEPLGAVLGIMPWNYPFWQVFRFAVPALMAGNAVLLKHAPGVPQCALAIESVFKQAALPAQLFQNLFITEDDVKLVIEHPLIKMVSLTGSERAGSAVAAIAGKNIKRSVLELGGSDPFIVLEDADMKQAVETAVKARMQNNGQSCIAAKRFIVVKAIDAQFTELVTKAVKQLKVGNPLDEDVQIGPLANENQAVQILKQIKKSVRQGAIILTGGDRPKSAGAFVNPTVLVNVKPGMMPFEEEIFGPVLSVIVVKDETEAIAFANQTQFGLGASLWTADTKKAEQLAKKINAGMVYINAMVKSDPRLPFGGINRSGYGRELSAHGIKEFTNVKTVWVN
jgi:succinate-semialdehyde dehydrogenase/glutarate-semialdehyde dehydrogenase